jgi:histidine ammonia-lyase
MGVHAADKLQRIVDNVRNVLAIELLCASQGVDLRAPHKPNLALQAAHSVVRAAVPHLDTDRPVYKDIQTLRRLIDDGSILSAVRQHLEIE